MQFGPRLLFVQLKELVSPGVLWVNEGDAVGKVYFFNWGLFGRGYEKGLLDVGKADLSHLHVITDYLETLVDIHF